MAKGFISCYQMSTRLFSETYCGVPQSIANGEIYGGSGSARYGATVQYRCFPGFGLNGSSTSTCQENGQWTTPPECQCKRVTKFSKNNSFSLSVKLIRMLKIS